MWERLMKSSSIKIVIRNLLIAGDQHQDEQLMVHETSIVDEEYTQALHTKPFMELYSKMHDHDHHNNLLNRTSIAFGKDRGKVPILDQSSYPDMILSSKDNNIRHACGTTSRNFQSHINTLLLDFFDTTSKSFLACATLLSSIAHAWSHHHSFHHLLLSAKSSSPSQASISKLSSFINLPNPLSPQNLSAFRRVHSYYPALVCQLTSAHRKIARRLKWQFLGSVKVERSVRKKVDAAARGAYIIGRDMDTMSVMLGRVHDEVEHGRDLARMALRNGEMWGVLVSEMRRREQLKELKELEEHIFLCLVTISGRRRFAAKEMHE